MPRLLCRSCLLLILSASSAFGQRNLKDIPDPDPELERKSFIVADGFEVNLYAADPQIAKPIQMNFDAAGRLWIASSEVYPHIKPGQKATDKILVVEDTDRNGVADKTSVFASDLLIPTGVLPSVDGVYAVNSTELLHFKDTDGDGKADRRRVVLSGFGTEDTHHLLHTLRWGHDGQIYMNQSIYIHSHIETPYGVKRLNAGGIWRFRPETLELDVFCRGFVNSWGHHQDYWGQSFATDGAYGEGINYVFPGSVWVTAQGAKRVMRGLNPGSPKHCGLEIISGRHLPDDWQGNMITNDFRAHRVCRFVVTENGSGYASRQQEELIKTSHVAFRPIDVKMGPDGAIYIADWYNPIIQHGEVDFRDPRRDHVHGRIWRVSRKGSPAAPWPNIEGATTEELLDSLKAPEEWIRLWAKLTLKERGREQVLPKLHKWLAELNPQEEDFEHNRLEGLWVYQNLNVVNRQLLHTLLASPDHRVRAAAVRVASAWQDRLEEPLDIYRKAVHDSHPRVRLEAIRALANLPRAAAAETALASLEYPQDDNLDFALWQAMRDLQTVWLPALERGEFGNTLSAEQISFALNSVESPAVAPSLLKLVAAGSVPEERLANVAALVARLGSPEEIGTLLRQTLEKQPLGESTPDVLASLVQETKARKLKPAGDLALLESLLKHENPQFAAVAARAAGAWKLEALRDTLVAMAGKENAEAAIQGAVIDAVSDLGGPQSISVLQVWSAAEGRPLPLRSHAANALASLDAAMSAGQMISLINAGVDPAEVLPFLLTRKEGPAALTAALAGKKLSPDAAKLAVRVARRTPELPPEVLEALHTAGGITAEGWNLNAEEKQKLVADIIASGNMELGEEIYRRKELQCIKCHAIGGAGGVVGPDLVSIGASAPVDYLLDSLLIPNSKVKEGFHSLVIQTDDGRLVTGIPVRRTERELVLRNAEGEELSLPLDSIEAEREGRSLMPDGTVNDLTRAELVDLVRFLSALGKVGELAVGKERLVRQWESLVWTQQALHRINRTSFDSATGDDEAFTWEMETSQVSGELPVTGLQGFVPFQGQPPTAVLRFGVKVSQPGEVKISFGNTAGLALWVDGKPVPIETEGTFNLAAGSHRFTLAVDQGKRKSPLRVELTGGSSAVFE